MRGIAGGKIRSASQDTGMAIARLVPEKVNKSIKTSSFAPIQ